TYTGHDTEEQDFVALVSAYGVRSGVVASATAYRHGETSEVAAAQDLIADLAAALDLRGVTLPLDALHATKTRSAAAHTPAATRPASWSGTGGGSTPSVRPMSPRRGQGAPTTPWSRRGGGRSGG